MKTTLVLVLVLVLATVVAAAVWASMSDFLVMIDRFEGQPVEAEIKVKTDVGSIKQLVVLRIEDGTVAISGLTEPFPSQIEAEFEIDGEQVKVRADVWGGPMELFLTPTKVKPKKDRVLMAGVLDAGSEVFNDVEVRRLVLTFGETVTAAPEYWVPYRSMPLVWAELRN